MVAVFLTGVFLLGDGSGIRCPDPDVPARRSTRSFTTTTGACSESDDCRFTGDGETDDADDEVPAGGMTADPFDDPACDADDRGVPLLPGDGNCMDLVTRGSTFFAGDFVFVTGDEKDFVTRLQ